MFETAASAIPPYPQNIVRLTGIEPARVSPLEPKSSASANSAIAAKCQVQLIYSRVENLGVEQPMKIFKILEPTLFLIIYIDLISSTFVS